MVGIVNKVYTTDESLKRSTSGKKNRSLVEMLYVG